MEYKKIILLDDNPTSFFYVEDVLSELFPDIGVQTFEDPDSFLEEFKNSFHHASEKILLLLDIMMPKKNGFDVLEEIDVECGEIDNMDVVILTSSHLESDLKKASRFPVVIGYIEKPFNKEKMEKVLTGSN